MFHVQITAVAYCITELGLLKKAEKFVTLEALVSPSIFVIPFVG